MSCLGKGALVVVALIVLGFLMVGAMVLFGLAISRPEQRRLQNAPRSSASTELPSSSLPPSVM